MIDTYETVNFQIFKNSYPELAEFCIFAEKYIHQDPIISLIKIRQFGELLAKELAASISLYTNPRESQYSLLNKLDKKGIIKSNVAYLFHQIRKAGNKANHEVSSNNEIEKDEHYQIALKQLNNCYKLSMWYLKLNRKYKENIPIPAFREPPKPNEIPKKEETILELETLDSNYKNVIQEINDVQNKPKDTEEIKQTITIAQKEAENIELEPSESDLGTNIDLLSVGSIIKNHYKITDILAAGNFGQTYLAEDTDSFNEKVVVKQFRPQFSDKVTINIAINLFEREARSLYKLNRIDGIPDLKAYFEENNQFFLVQEFIDGYTLEEEILVGNKLTESEVINLLKDILKPLKKVHDNDIIHRDIKPSNLMRNINDQQIYLIDFGAVKEVMENTTNRTIAIGTTGYMPFEQLQGQPQFNSDIYAVGKICIQAATGLKVSDIDNQKWQTQATDLSDKIIYILEKMIAISYQDRYSSVQEILDELDQEILEEEEVGPDPEVDPDPNNDDKPISQPSQLEKVLTKPLKDPRTLNITVFGPRGVGKTSILAAMYDQFNQTTENIDIQLTANPKTSAILQERVAELQSSFNLPEDVEATGGIQGTSEPQDFLFELSRVSRPTIMKLCFKDFPGGRIGVNALETEMLEVQQLLKDCKVVLIVIDTPALMEANGSWHQLINQPNLIRDYFKLSYKKITEPNLILFVPSKCEKYMRSNPDQLLEKVKEGYRDLLHFFSNKNHRHNLIVGVTPVQTLGNIVFDRIKTNVMNGKEQPHFYYKKVGKQYEPHDSEQPLRYILKFFLKLHLKQQNPLSKGIRFVFRLGSLFEDKAFKDAVNQFGKLSKTGGGFAILQDDKGWLK